jgi:AAA15 family ATPase/GTPase
MNMLVRLFGRNFRSLKAPFELSMVAADLRRAEDRTRGVIEVLIAGAAEPLRLLRTVAIFGANASGKSTVLTAGRALHWLVTQSSARSKPDDVLPPYEPFLLDADSRVAPVELGCDVVCGTSLLRYEVAYSLKAIEREVLTVFDEKGETRLIDRQSPGNVQGELISRSDANRLYVKEMQPNVAVLSKLAQHGPHKGEESVQPFYRAVRDATQCKDYSNSAAAQFKIGDSHDERFADDAQYREWIMRHLIRSADVGICDVETRRESVEIPEFLQEEFAKAGVAGRLPDKRVVVAFVHKGASNQPIDFSYESSGTQKLFNLAGDWWALANKSITVLADELSASLHPRLLDSLIRAVNCVPADGVRSQFVFATHDTGLLEGRDGLPPALRRDQVYFTRKDSLGASELYSLAEFRDDARTVHNLRKRYLSGLYGALPSAEGLSL